MADDAGTTGVARTLSEIAHLLASAEDARRRVLRALTLIRSIVPYDSCAILDASAKAGPDLLVVPDLPTGQRRDLNVRLQGLLRLLGDEADERAAPNADAMVSAPSATTHIAVPIVGLNKVTGLLFVERGSGPYDEQSVRWLSVAAAQLGAYLTTLRLREDEIEHARQLNLVLRRLEETDRRKDEFLAMLGHELRNPLGAITTALHLLDDRAVDPSNRYYKVIDRQIKYLSHIVDDLLDASRVRLGKIVLEKRVVNLSDVVRRWMEAFGDTSLVQSHEVKLLLAGRPVQVDGDVVRLEQIFSNVMTNALKYTPAGRQIRVRVEQEDSRAVVRVEDDGIGMTPDVLDTIFDLFTQADESLARSRGGLGLGLPLVKNLVEMHGGTIDAWSEGLGHGSTFAIRLPLTNRVDTELDEPRRDSRSASPETLQVLIVEDSDDAREMLEAMLGNWGHHVRCAANGSDGLKQALGERPDVALIDIGLPGIDGYEVAKRIRREIPPSELALIAMTGYGQPEDRRRAFDAGFDNHMVKPLDMTDLRRELAKIVPRSRG